MSKRKTTEEFIEEARKIHPNYDYSKVNYINNKTNIIITCPTHGDVLITPLKFLKSSTGCPKCGRYNSNIKRRKTLDIFKRDIYNRFPHYDTSKTFYINYITPVTITCPTHGDFQIKPRDFYNGGGCQKCGKEQQSKKIKEYKKTSTFRKTLTHKEFIRRMEILHPEYDYTRTLYSDGNTQVTVTCPIHGDFQITSYRLLYGHGGCQKCGVKLRSDKLRKSPEQFKKEIAQIFPKYGLDKVHYINSYTKVIITCPKHGDFLSKPNSLLEGMGCPICNESKGEREIRYFLESHNIMYKPQYKFKNLGNLSYDFYLPGLNILIEYNGKQHYQIVDFFYNHKNNSTYNFQQQLERDQRKKEYAEKNGYKLLVIPYTDFDNIESILEKNILSSQK